MGDSWFEEGVRVFYIFPDSAMESILPLQVEPRPDRIARVFVGRVEIFTPQVRNIVAIAIANQDRVTLEKYGRFLAPLTRGVVRIHWFNKFTRSTPRLRMAAEKSGEDFVRSACIRVYRRLSCG